MLLWDLFIDQFVNPVGREGDGVKGWIVILARCKFNFIKEYEILVYDLSNNISIIKENHDNQVQMKHNWANLTILKLKL